MNSQKYISLPLSTLGDVQEQAEKIQFSSPRPSWIAAWLKRYGIPLLGAVGFHAGLAFWPTEKSVMSGSAGTAEMAPAGSVQMVSSMDRPTPADSSSGDDSVAADSPPADQTLSVTLPTLPEALFEYSTALRQEIGEYARAHGGKSGSALKSIPAPSLNGSALAGIGGAFQSTTTFAPEPYYPSAARQQGREGIVELEVKLRLSGRVDTAVVSKSSGHLDLDRAAQETVMSRWRFPAGQGGELATQHVRVAFHLTAAERRR